MKKRKRHGRVVSHAFATKWFADGSSNFWVLVGFFALVVLTGGSARPDVMSLMILRPTAVFVTAYGFWTLRRDDIREHRFLFSMAAAIIALAAMHLVPLPPMVWLTLPGRELIAEIDRTAGLGQIWRPLSMAPAFSWNALYSLFVPLAVLVHGIQLRGEEITRMLVVVVVAGVASSLLALLQTLGTPDGPLYLYRIANSGAAVGFFANRNHQALLLASLLPMLAVYASYRGGQRREDRMRLFACLAISSFIIPLLLVTGSRAGFAAGILGVISMPFLYKVAGGRFGDRRRASRFKIVAALSLLGVASITTWAIVAGRAEAIRRALEADPNQELRYKYWTVILDQMNQFMPLGSGTGSYERVFQAIEPSDILVSSYSNHAHNDWLELVLTTGVPGAFLLTVSVIAYLITAWKLISGRGRGRRVAFGWLGLVIILMIAIGSVVDYPLRVPTLMALFVIACLWSRLGTTSAPEAQNSNGVHGAASLKH